jgi:peptidoglycan/LPS O-acetylase OafA/YrhL
MAKSVRDKLGFKLTADAFSQKRDIAIDGIRGVVSTAVVIGHYSSLGMPQAAKIADSAIFPYAVSMFAAMSGYVLYAGLRRFEPLPGNEIRSFLIRRFFRIYPLYAVYFIIVLAGILATTHISGRQFLTLMSDMLMLDVLHFGWRIQSATWSLYPEMLFSLLLPFWLLLAGRNWKSVGACYVLLAVFSWAATPNGPTDASFNLLRYFFLGMVLEHFIRYLRSTEVPRWLSPLLYVSFLLAVVLSLAFSTWAGDGTTLPAPLALYRHIGISFHQDLCILMLVPPILLCPLLRKAFSNPVLVFLGIISYGVYILHEPLAFLLHGTSFAWQQGIIGYDLATPGAPLGTAALPLYWLIVVGIATLCHFAVERPMIRWSYALVRQQRAKSEDGTAGGEAVALGQLK